MTTKKQTVVEEEEPPKAEIRDVKSRRTIKLLFSECPLCKLGFTESAQVLKDEDKQYFQLVQYGANPDGTGYESYHCQFCDRFFMMIISVEPIQVEYDFKPVGENAQQGKPKGGFASIFEELLKGGGNGQQ